ncbi:MAG: hypothetical protein ArsCj_2860 [Arsenophonus endosymbiont of Ceratovacuna japonica]
MKCIFIKNIKIIITGLIIIFFIVIICSYWKLYKTNNLEESAKKFECIYSKLQTNSKQTLITCEEFADKENNIYSVLTYISLAKIAVEKKDIIWAEKILIKALTVTKLNDLKDLINIRLSRIQLELNKTDQAMITLNKIKNKGWNAIIQNIRGDILLKNNNINEAKSAYYKGIKLSRTETIRTILKIKINNLLR